VSAAEKKQGTVRRVFFANPDSPFMAGLLALDDGTEMRFSGKCFADVGDKLELVGKWETHPKYGRQFEAETGLVRMDESPEALVHLLASHKDFKGLGPARARKVVDAALALSDDGEAASALVEYPEEIASRAGVDISIVHNAATVWAGRKTYFEALAALGDHGWSSAQSMKIVSRLGENAPAMVKADPYMLIGCIPRFGFRTVDVVARKMGVKSTDPLRLAAGVAYCLDRIADNGNTWTTREGLLEEAVAELRPDTLGGEDAIRSTITDLVLAGLIYVDKSPVGNEIVSDARLARTEIEVFGRLVNGLGAAVYELEMTGSAAIAVVPTLNAGQQSALAGFSSRRVSVISGGAGVGKTYMVKAICDVAEENGLRVALCAPTGKAARKIEHATKRKASTIHRLLVPRFDDETGDFKFTCNANNPLDVDLVVVDEVSMVDVRLMRSLLVALPPECRLLLVGDHHQIPSVGPGAILRDLLSAKDRYPQAVHVLTEIVRQAGILARNTTAILDGVVTYQPDSAWGIERTEKGHEKGSAAMLATLVEAVVTSPEPLEPFGRPLDFAWDVQVLAPMKKGPLGVWALNVHLQKLRQRLLGNPPPEATPEGKSPKPMVGDRVIWTRNDYELDLFNGTQGIVLGFKKGGAMEMLTEDGRDVTVPATKRLYVEVAYAMTIHKSQGSEWPLVVLVVSSSHWIVHDRNLLYTGASRAAESLTIVGDKHGIAHFAAERRSAQRQTLGGFLVHGWAPMQHPQQVASPSPAGTS
jgi:exodeoxyribonuclease V alpha subunit